MRVTYDFHGILKTVHVMLNNVIWVRVTGEKVIVECQDGRRVELRHKMITGFEVIHA